MPKSVSNAARSSKAQNKLHVVKGDRVKVITGKDKGLVGEVIAVYPETQRVLGDHVAEHLERAAVYAGRPGQPEDVFGAALADGSVLADRQARRRPEDVHQVR